MKLIPLIDCIGLPKDVTEYLLDKHDCACHYDHDILQIEDDGNVFAEWLKAQGYKFKSKPDEYPGFDLIALYGS